MNLNLQNTTVREPAINKNKYQDIIKKIILINLSLFFTLLIYVNFNIVTTLLSFITLLSISLVMVNFNIMHPYVWYLPFYTLYSISYAILYLEGTVLNNVNLFQLNNSLFIFWIGFITFIIIIPTNEYPNRLNLEKLKVSSRLINSILVICFFSITIMSGYIVSSGASSKQEIALLNNPILTLGNYAINFFVLAYTIKILQQIRERNNSSINKYFIALVLCTTLLVVLIAGERDFIVRIVVITSIVVHVMIKRISPLRILFYGIFGLGAFATLQNLKGFFISNAQENQFIDKSIFSIILNGEFSSAGRNLYLLTEQSYGGFFINNPTIINDLKFAVSNLPLISLDAVVPTSWFNNLFYGSVVERGGGKGFTFVGEGFINFGLLGTFLWMAFIAIVVRGIYKKSCSNIYWFIVYLVIIPMTVYVLRADFGIYLSFIVKYVLIPIFLLIFSEKIFESLGKNRKNLSR